MKLFIRRNWPWNHWNKINTEGPIQMVHTSTFHLDNTAVYTSSTSFIQQNWFGKWYYLRLIFSVYFLPPYSLAIYLNYWQISFDRETINYIPARYIWMNMFYFSLSSESKNTCLTIDCRKSGPPKYRTSANFIIMRKTKRMYYTIHF